MKNVKNYLLCVLMMMLICFILSCDKASPTQSEPNVICFTVDGHSVTLSNFWNDGTSYTKNVRGLISFNATTTRNNETHNLIWTNIVSDYNRVYSFNVKIDGEDYSYPRDKCGGGPEYKIEFKLNGTTYRYEEACGQPYYPYGYYHAARGNMPEQYNIIGSETIADCNANKNTIMINFSNVNGWLLGIHYYDANGNSINFNTLNVDISILQNRDAIGEEMSASISGPIQTHDGANTLSDLSFSVERIESPEEEPELFLTHNTGNLAVSIFENGNIGHMGFSGEGIQFKGYPEAIYSAGLIMGTTTGQSVNGHLASFAIQDDLVNTVPISGFISSPPYWDQVAEATFNDSGAPFPFDINVNQISYSNTGENSMIIQYRLYGNSSSYNDLFVGIFADWDIGETTYDTNLGGYDPARNLAFQYDSTGTNDPNYYGIVALTGMSGARVTTEGTFESIRDSSFNWITTFLNEPITTPDDYRMWIGSGPFALSVSDTLDVFFAIVAGTDLNDLNVNTDAAIQKYNSVFHE